jgi:hypothetical protein
MLTCVYEVGSQLRLIETAVKFPWSNEWTMSWSVSTSKESNGNLHYNFKYKLRNYLNIKNAVFWDVIPCGSCKKWRFGGMYRLHHQSDKNRRYIPTKHRFLQEPHDVPSQKTAFFLVTAVKASNLTYINIFLYNRMQSFVLWNFYSKYVSLGTDILDPVLDKRELHAPATVLFWEWPTVLIKVEESENCD